MGAANLNHEDRPAKDLVSLNARTPRWTTGGGGLRDGAIVGDLLSATTTSGRSACERCSMSTMDGVW